VMSTVEACHDPTWLGAGGSGGHSPFDLTTKSRYG
jgi:hypothetical protein